VNHTVYKTTSYIYDLKFVNINNDPYLDIAAAGTSGFGARAFFYNFTNSSWDEHSNGLTTNSCWGIDCQDVDNNGITELLTYLRLYSWNQTGDMWDYIDYLDSGNKKNHFIDLNFDGLMDIIIPDGDTLTIQPGVTLLFRYHTGIKVYGCLKSIGTLNQIDFMKIGESIFQGGSCLKIINSHSYWHQLLSPISGNIIDINEKVIINKSLLEKDPYFKGWIYKVIPSNLEYELNNITPCSTDI